MKKRVICLALLSTLALAAVSRAEVKLAGLFTDHMVLQRDMAMPVWGTASPGEKVSVTLGERKASATADDAGNWRAKLDAMPVGGPYELTIAGGNTITLKDVLIGDVWICSGQSNMQWSVKNSDNPEKEIAAAKYPNIRLYSVTRATSLEPLSKVEGKWQACSPETVPDFSAVGYYFGRELHKALDVPIGLVNTSWGGTPIEAWTPAEGGKPTEAAGDDADAKKEPLKPGVPTVLYNGMIHPLIPFAIRGAIWYQGESNAGRAYKYRKDMPGMIRAWRKNWGQGDFPFFMVQLANFQAGQKEPYASAWAELREAQLMALAEPKTGMAVAIDIGNPKDIHPRNKQEVGRRLALAARAVAYGEKLPYSGPMYDSHKVDGDKIVLKFKHTDGGLAARAGEKLTGFGIAGEDHNFVDAEATIRGDTVVVQSDAVARPVAVRYAWGDSPDCNLVNGAGLPASPFRTDDWPGITQKTE